MKKILFFFFTFLHLSSSFAQFIEKNYVHISGNKIITFNFTKGGTFALTVKGDTHSTRIAHEYTCSVAGRIIILHTEIYLSNVHIIAKSIKLDPAGNMVINDTMVFTEKPELKSTEKQMLIKVLKKTYGPYDYRNVDTLQTIDTLSIPVPLKLSKEEQSAYLTDHLDLLSMSLMEMKNYKAQDKLKEYKNGKDKLVMYYCNGTEDNKNTPPSFVRINYEGESAYIKSIQPSGCESRQSDYTYRYKNNFLSEISFPDRYATRRYVYSVMEHPKK